MRRKGNQGVKGMCMPFFLRPNGFPNPSERFGLVRK